jgi:outer membrane lipoprotein-sorting protein
MKLLSLILPVALLTSLSNSATADSAGDLRAIAATFDCSLFRAASAPPDLSPLDAVLKKMDAASSTFRSAQADFEWTNYEKVIDEVDEVDTGTIYYRRNGKDIDMMAEVKKSGSSLAALKPEPKFVLLSGGKIRLYQPKMDQVTEFDLGKNRSEWESYIVLGFGSSGQDLVRTFDVTYVGPETIDGIATAQLKLVPKSEKIRNTYKEIYLWIDLERGISVQQKLVQPQGDYRLIKYSNIQLNGKKIPDDVFKLKTTSKTQTVIPKG